MTNKKKAGQSIKRQYFDEAGGWDSDTMVMTSFVEGSPNVVKEAMACNIPIASVDVGDVSELLSGVNGCIESSCWIL